MYRKDYEDKMQNLVNDTETYTNIPRDPTGAIQTRSNNIVKRLLNLNLIDTKMSKALTVYNATCPCIYGQPKAHKASFPLRPVVPNITAPTYYLSKYIAQILQSSLHSKYSIRNSFDFCKTLNQIKLPDNYIIISLNVVSLFTNVPQHLVTKTLIERWKEVKTNINLDLFLEMVEFCMKSSYFCYQQKFYRQVQGTAMGSPLSPILAEIVLDAVIDQAIKQLPYEIPFIRKYVDDLFVAVPNEATDTVLQVFNSQEEKLQFTCEIEKDHKLAFLDMQVYRSNDQRLYTEWYSKPISSGRILNYHSFHHMKHKINVASNLIHRVIALTSMPCSTQTCNSTIHNILAQNSYPRTLINRLINKYRGNKPATNYNISSTSEMRYPEQVDASIDENRQSSQSRIFCPVLYISTLTERLTKILAQDYANVSIAYRNNKSISSLHTRVKDQKNKMHMTHIVYKIECGSCEHCYIGMTQNKLQTRMAGHQSNVNKLDHALSTGHQNELATLREKTALLDHCIAHDHRFDFNKTKIIDSSYNVRTLQFLEMCHIYNTPNTVNKRTDVDQLNATYAAVLHTTKTHSNRRNISRVQLQTK